MLHRKDAPSGSAPGVFASQGCRGHGLQLQCKIIQWKLHGGLAGNSKHDALAVLTADQPAPILPIETHASQMTECPIGRETTALASHSPQPSRQSRGRRGGAIAAFVADGIWQHVEESKMAADGICVILELVAGLLLPDERTANLAVCYVPPRHKMTYRGTWQSCLWTTQC